MFNFLKKNFVTVLIVGATIVLAGVAIFTALKLYQLRQVAVAPNVPESKPAAQEVAPTPTAPPATNCQTLTFTITTATASPTASPSPSPTPVVACNDVCSSDTQCPSGMICSGGRCRNESCTSSTNCVCATATPTPTPTAPPTISCNSTCTEDTQCPGGMICSGGRCRNESCTSSTTCVCATATPTPIVQATAAPAQELPVAGTSTPTIIGIIGGIILVIGALVIAL